MSRTARVVIPGLLHHVTQRGNWGQQIFFTDADREFYLERLKLYAVKADLGIASYCLMDTHSHLLVEPAHVKSLSMTFKPLNLCYSKYLNRRAGRLGLNWQGRFFSSPMDEGHSWNAFKYVAGNPERARMVVRSVDYPWSSAATHLTGSIDSILTASPRWLRMAHEAVGELT